MAELKPSFYFVVEYRRKLLKDELSNKEAQTKLVEKMLGDVKLN
jgi:F-type H+-transporting ATPase subunit b